MTEATAGTPAKKHTIGWWLAAIIAPIGIVGGPIAIADMVAGAIQWNGWIGYLVAFWDENVSKSFGVVLNFVASIIRIPALNELTVDYITLGILLFGGFVRAIELLPLPGTPRVRQRTLGEKLGLAVIWIAGPLAVIAFWPFYIFTISAFFIAYAIHAIAKKKKKTILPDGLLEMAPIMGMTIAPFVLFLALCALNTVAGTPPPA